MPYDGDNCFETMSSCYFHYKSTVLKLGSMEAFLEGVSYLPIIVSKIVYGCTFFLGECKPLWKTKLILPISFNLPGKGERLSRYIFVLKVFGSW